MTTTEHHDVPPGGTSAEADGGITRLDAYDGLFLRAEHFRLIQDYARDLAYAVGAAGGPGVVEGFAVTTLADGRLQVGPGLAVAPDGRPLRSTEVIVVDRPEARPADTWYRIELHPSDRPYGQVRLGTRLCEPCGDGATDPESGTATPYRAEGVRVVLVADSEPQFDGWPIERRRGLLAQLLFRREENREPPAWPGRPGNAALPDTWDPQVPSTPAAGIPLAVLAPLVGDAWVLDTWIVRRDRTATPPDDAWRRLLAMRPWSVFVAQLLQFQAHYADLGTSTGTVTSAPTIGEFVEKYLREHGGEEALTPDALRAMAAEADAADGSGSGREASAPLVAVMPELPPAGFLAAPRSDPEGRAWLLRLLGDGVSVSFTGCGVGDVGLAIEQARHRHRIRLAPPESGPRDAVEILVPVEVGEGEVPTFRRVTDWVAFVHRDGTGRTQEDGARVLFPGGGEGEGEGGGG